MITNTVLNFNKSHCASRKGSCMSLLLILTVCIAMNCYQNSPCCRPPFRMRWIVLCDTAPYNQVNEIPNGAFPSRAGARQSEESRRSHDIIQDNISDGMSIFVATYGHSDIHEAEGINVFAEYSVYRTANRISMFSSCFRSSIKLISNAFFPASLIDAPTWYSSDLSRIRNLSWNSSENWISSFGYWLLKSEISLSVSL